MNNDIKNKIDKGLSHMEWKGSREVMKKINNLQQKSQKRFYLKPIFTIYALILILSSTALAVGLHYSQEYTIIKKAKEAVVQKYDLDERIIDALGVEKTNNVNEKEIKFFAQSMNVNAIGVYKVIINNGEIKDISWSYDNVDPKQYANGNLEDEVWGPAQIRKAMDLKSKEYKDFANIDWQDVDSWSLEKRAEIDSVFTDSFNNGLLPRLNIIPETEDIKENDAIIMAKKSIIDKYGIKAEELDKCKLIENFYKVANTKERFYEFWFTNDKSIKDVTFNVVLQSPNGKVKSCLQISVAKDFILPEGDLKLYPEAVKEYVENGFFNTLSADKKAEIYNRFVKAGLEDLLGKSNYQKPNQNDISEKQALEKANKAMADNYGVSKNLIKLFENSISMIKIDNANKWEIKYTPIPTYDEEWDIAHKLGIYTIYLKADDGSVYNMNWEFSGMETDKAINESNWGSENVYGKKILPYLEKLIISKHKIIDKYTNDETIDQMSVEDAAAHDKLYVDAGFPKKEYIFTITEKDEMSKEDAITKAKQIISNEKGVKIEELDKFRLNINCFYNKDVKTWGLSFHDYKKDSMDVYTVLINAQTGELINFIHDDETTGNG